MLADIDFVDDTSPLYTVRWAWPLKNDTIQLYTYAGRSSSDILDSSVEWRTESKALEKSRDMTMTYGLAWSRLVIVWRREMTAEDVEPVGRKAN